MSQYRVDVKHNGVDKVILYGYDRPLQEYFAQEIIVEKYGEEDPWPTPLVGTLGERPGTNGHLAEALMELGVWEQIPEAHRFAIASDLVF